MIIVSDTSPLNYLVLIGQVERLRDLYGRVIIPQAVYDELQTVQTPAEVRAWLMSNSEWLEVRTSAGLPDSQLDHLGAGEREAIALAEQLQANALLIDDRDGRREAARRHLKVIGTLAVLVDAAQHGLLDLPEAFDRLQQTTFRASPRLFDVLLELHRASTAKNSPGVELPDDE